MRTPRQLARAFASGAAQSAGCPLRPPPGARGAPCRAEGGAPGRSPQCGGGASGERRALRSRGGSGRPLGEGARRVVRPPPRSRPCGGRRAVSGRSRGPCRPAPAFLVSRACQALSRVGFLARRRREASGVPAPHVSDLPGAPAGGAAAPPHLTSAPPLRGALCWRREHVKAPGDHSHVSMEGGPLGRRDGRQDSARSRGRAEQGAATRHQLVCTPAPGPGTLFICPGERRPWALLVGWFILLC